MLLCLCILVVPEGVAQPYARQIDAFPVRDSAGISYTHPWLGGLNVPRPQFADLDGDGDLDLFVQERTGSLIYFENTGSKTLHRYVWRTDAFADLDVGEWARFADLDNDGDLDMLAEQPFSFIRVYRNVGTAPAPRFEHAADTLKSIDGTPIFSDRQNLPALADIDCDGLLDLFIATFDGFLSYYANEGLDRDSLPAYRFVTDRYQDLAIIGGFGKRPPQADLHTPKPARHGAAALAFGDLDRDADPDLFWGDFFSPSLYFIENKGSCEAPALELVTDLFPADDPLETRGFNVPAFGDLDGDEDLDLFTGTLGGAFSGGPHSADNFYFFRQDDDFAFSLQSRQFISSLDVDEESVPAFADLDGDGDLDLVVGNKIDPVSGQRAQLFYFINEGTPQAPAFRLVEDLLHALEPPGRIFNIAPALADLDGDTDLDILLGRFDGTLALLLNDGTREQPRFTWSEALALDLFAGVSIDVGQNSTPAFFDVDGDSDLDLVVGEAAGTLTFFRNTGTAAQPRFELEASDFGGIDAGARSAPTFHDVTGDEQADLLVGTAIAGVRVYRNTTTSVDPSFTEAGVLALPGTIPRFAVPAFADLDADGDRDVLLGGLSGGLFFYRNDAIFTATEADPARGTEPSALLSNHPNPFRDATTLQFHLPQPGRVHLAVYDALGRLVSVPVAAWLSSGRHRVSFDASVLPAGLYVYTLTTAAGTSVSGSMIRVK